MTSHPVVASEPIAVPGDLPQADLAPDNAALVAPASPPGAEVPTCNIHGTLQDADYRAHNYIVQARQLVAMAEERHQEAVELKKSMQGTHDFIRSIAPNQILVWDGQANQHFDPTAQQPRQQRGAGNFLNALNIAALLLGFVFLCTHLFKGTLPNTTITPSPTTTPVQIQVSNMSSTEQTFIAIKPDGVQRGLVGPIISRFENRGYKLAGIKLVTPGKEHLEKHYADLKDKPFFAGLVTYMNSGPICAMVWEGRDAVKTGRVLLGATNPLASAPGTIRGDFSIDVGRNVCHGSDSVENAKKEIALWFKDGEVVSWKSAQQDWIYEKP